MKKKKTKEMIMERDDLDYLKTQALVEAILTLFASHQIKHICALTSLTYVMAQIMIEISRDEEELRSAMLAANKTLVKVVSVIVEKKKKDNKDFQST